MRVLCARPCDFYTFPLRSRLYVKVRSLFYSFSRAHALRTRMRTSLNSGFLNSFLFLSFSACSCCTFLFLNFSSSFFFFFFPSSCNFHVSLHLFFSFPHKFLTFYPLPFSFLPSVRNQPCKHTIYVND